MGLLFYIIIIEVIVKCKKNRIEYLVTLNTVINKKYIELKKKFLYCLSFLLTVKIYIKYTIGAEELKLY